MAVTRLRGPADGHARAASPVLEPADVEALVAAENVLARALEDRREQAERSSAEAERMRREAYAVGFEEGRAAAAAAFAATVVEQARLAGALESYVLRAVMVGIRTVLGELPADERMRRLVQRAIRQVPTPGSLTLHVHADDVAAAGEAIESFPGGGMPPIRVVADAMLDRDACRIESEFGGIEASLAVQLDAVERALTGVASERGLGAPTSAADPRAGQS